MNCFVTLSLPEYVLQAMVFAGVGEAAERAWVVVSAPAPVSRVLAVNPLARQQGVAAGQNEIEARALAPQLIVRLRSPEAEMQLQRWLSAHLDEVSPRVQRLSAQSFDASLWLLDMAGLRRLRGPVLEQARGLREHLRRHGLEARIGIATTGTAAVLAALAAGVMAPPVWFLTAGREQQDLARLPLLHLAHFPIAALALSREVQKRPGRSRKKKQEPAAPQWEDALALLERWGLKTLGDLARLPVDGVVERLGQMGALLHFLARGEECGLLEPKTDGAEQLEFSLEWDPPESDRERILAAARARLAELERELVRRDRVVERITLHAVAQTHPEQDAMQICSANQDRPVLPGAGDWRAVRPLLVPLRDLRGLAAQLEAALAARPSQLPVTVLTVRLELTAPRRIQPRLFEEANLDPGKLDRLLERLRELLDDPAGRRIGSPCLLDSWHPEAFVMRPFALEMSEWPSPPSWRGPPGLRAASEFSAATGMRGLPAAASRSDADAVREAHATKETLPLCLVRFRPPVPVRLRFPAAVAAPEPTQETLVGAECLLEGASAAAARHRLRRPLAQLRRLVECRRLVAR